METITIQRSLDRRGKSITTYVVYDAVAELANMKEGELLELLTDDFEPFEPDIAAFCETTGHRLVATETTMDGIRFLIEKASPRKKDNILAMVVSSDGLEELLSPLGFALAAALEGIHVHLYIQGPAVRVVSRGFKPKMRGWSRPITRFAASGMAKAGHIPAQEKLRQLRSLGAMIYMCGPSMDHYKVRQDDLIFPNLPLVEYLSFMAVMEKADIHVYT